jgi:hypothetical protein
VIGLGLVEARLIRLMCGTAEPRAPYDPVVVAPARGRPGPAVVDPLEHVIPGDPAHERQAPSGGGIDSGPGLDEGDLLEQAAFGAARVVDQF